MCTKVRLMYNVLCSASSCACELVPSGIQCQLRNVTCGNSYPRALQVIGSAGHRLTPAAKELIILWQEPTRIILYTVDI